MAIVRWTDVKEGQPFGPILITTDSWFYGPDGRQYKGVFGIATLRKAEDIMGFKPEHSSNWILEFAGGVIVMGCQIHYAVIADKAPKENTDILDAGNIWRTN